MELEDVVKAAAYLLSEGGTFSMVHKPFRLAEIMRLMMDVPFADTFTVGVDLQQNWISSGVLPNAKGGAAEKLAVTIDKK